MTQGKAPSTSSPVPLSQSGPPEPTQANSLSPHLEGLNLDWSGYLAAGEYRRALAAARLSPAPLPSALTSSLEGLSDFQEQVRARKYSQARRSLVRLNEEAGDAGPELAQLRRSVDLPALDAALASLEAAETERYVEPDALRSALAPALGVPLTRAEALNAVGVLHALHEETDAAYATFAQALAADAGHYRAISNIGNLELQTGNLAGAEAAQRRAIALNPEFAGAHHNLGVILRKQGKLNDSVKAIRKGQRLAIRRLREDTPRGLAGLASGAARGPRAWLTPAHWRVIGIIIAVVVFYLFLRGR